MDIMTANNYLYQFHDKGFVLVPERHTKELKRILETKKLGYTVRRFLDKNSYVFEKYGKENAIDDILKMLGF